jgi:hypothetical protein
MTAILIVMFLLTSILCLTVGVAMVIDAIKEIRQWFIYGMMVGISGVLVFCTGILAGSMVFYQF